MSISLSFCLGFSLRFSLRFSLSLSLENSVVSVVVVLVVVSKVVRSVVSRHVALGEDGVVVVGIVGPIAVESCGAAVITLSSTGPRSKIAGFSLGFGLRLGNSRSNEKCKYQEFHG